MKTVEFAIVGGGLSGIALCLALQKHDYDVCIVESRSRLGGRIKTQMIEYKNESTSVDLGPAWYWPGQPRMQALVDSYTIPVFEQYAQGTQRFEDERGHVFHGQGYASMQGAYRLLSGMLSLIELLSKHLTTDHILLNTHVHTLERTDNGIRILDDQQECIMFAQRVILGPVNTN